VAEELNPEWKTLEAILDKADTPVQDMMDVLNMKRESTRFGRSMGLLLIKIPLRTGDDSWEAVERCRITSKVRLRDWIKKHRPETEMKLQAVEVDRHLNRKQTFPGVSRYVGDSLAAKMKGAKPPYVIIDDPYTTHRGR
jgi:hypothetical protein